MQPAITGKRATSALMASGQTGIAPNARTAPWQATGSMASASSVGADGTPTQPASLATTLRSVRSATSARLAKQTAPWPASRARTAGLTTTGALTHRAFAAPPASPERGRRPSATRKTTPSASAAPTARTPTRPAIRVASVKPARPTTWTRTPTRARPASPARLASPAR